MIRKRNQYTYTRINRFTDSPETGYKVNSAGPFPRDGGGLQFCRSGNRRNLIQRESNVCLISYCSHSLAEDKRRQGYSKSSSTERT